MPDVVLRPEAEADIELIADYTIARWGLEQARTYTATLRADIASLASFPERFPVHAQSGLGLQRMRSGHHLVFYLVSEVATEIVRVLHERQDPTPDLP
ncbi:MAG TPA: type II toxin-antitoxin system RelE/ParE family toxin [Croceibacterium sp.]